MRRVAVVRFPGSNCDWDTLHAAQRGGGEAYFVWHRETDLKGADVVLLPGGFSYGDYLRSGAIARFSPIMPAVQAFAQAGGPVLGICNGFQILCEAGLLPGALMRNSRLSFVSRPVLLRVEQPDTAFTNRYGKGALLRMPVAHGDGRFTADERTLQELEATGRVVVRYMDLDGTPLRETVNGSLHDIAGITNANGNVVGLMPHPDRAADPAIGNTDGLGFFSSVFSWAGGGEMSGSTGRRFGGSAVGGVGLLLALLGAGPAVAQSPVVVSIKPGMTETQVVEAWGTPLTRRSHGIMSYLYYRNDCLARCGTYDIVFLERGQVIDAIVRDARRRYDGISSSPPDRKPEQTVRP